MRSGCLRVKIETEERISGRGTKLDRCFTLLLCLYHYPPSLHAKFWVCIYSLHQFVVKVLTIIRGGL